MRDVPPAGESQVEAALIADYHLGLRQVAAIRGGW